MKKKLFVLGASLLALAGLAACGNQASAVSEDTTFELVIRKFNGQDANYSPKLDGIVLASKTIKVEAGQVTVSDALLKASTLENEMHKISFTSTDYISFSETTVGYSTSWYLTTGHMDKEPGYTDEDYQWSYMAFNDHYSNGVTADFLDGLKSYTIVIDGWDGQLGGTQSY